MSFETSPFKAGTIWLGLLEYPGYLIGVHGEVVSMLKGKPRVLRPIRVGNYDGYQLRGADGRLHKEYRHRLVATVVHGPCPAGHECRHIDGDKTNADYTNLRWGTPQENTNDKRRHGSIALGEKHPFARLNETTVRLMRERRASGQTFKDIAAEFSVSTMTAYRAVTGQTWGHVQ